MEEREKHKNSVKGIAHGKKRPEWQREKCLLELLTNENVLEVARKNNVPESTLRSWLEKAIKPGPNGEKSEWQKAREENIHKIAQTAAAGALAGAKLMEKRIKRSAARENEAERIYRGMREAEEAGDAEGAKRMKEQMAAMREAMPPESAFGLTNMFRALMDKGALAAGENTENVGHRIEVVLQEDAAEYAD